MRRAGRILLAVATAGACAGPEAAEPRRTARGFSEVAAGQPTRALMNHGISVGDRIGGLDKVCPHTPKPGAGAWRVLTFATPYDCSRCNEHLAGIAKLEKSGAVPGGASLVVYAANDREIERAFSQDTTLASLPLCTDRSGALWDGEDLRHTPFTVLVEGDTVRYITDLPLAQPKRAEEFLADVARIRSSGG